jgi:ubiquinone/menaquinone biosynthesis C-methylase UbiE
LRATIEWRARARRDPLHAVASHPGTAGNRWKKEEFYALGRSDWADFRVHWEQYAGPLGGTCLEIGCGAGRITHALADDFERVVGIDVSEDMLRLAREVVDAEYHIVSDAVLPVASSSVEGVFTCHVLQHFDAERDIVDALRESHRVLRENGTIMAHLLVTRDEGGRARMLVRELRYRVTLRLRPGLGTTVARRYHPAKVREMFEAAGFVDVEMREFRLASNGDPHAFWFGRCRSHTVAEHGQSAKH